jgi:hypothetical protein
MDRPAVPRTVVPRAKVGRVDRGNGRSTGGASRGWPGQPLPRRDLHLLGAVSRGREPVRCSRPGPCEPTARPIEADVRAGRRGPLGCTSGAVRGPLCRAAATHSRIERSRGRRGDLCRLRVGLATGARGRRSEASAGSSQTWSEPAGHRPGGDLSGPPIVTAGSARGSSIRRRCPWWRSTGSCRRARWSRTPDRRCPRWRSGC